MPHLENRNARKNNRNVNGSSAQTQKTRQGIRQSTQTIIPNPQRFTARTSSGGRITLAQLPPT